MKSSWIKLESGGIMSNTYFVILQIWCSQFTITIIRIFPSISSHSPSILYSPISLVSPYSCCVCTWRTATLTGLCVAYIPHTCSWCSLGVWGGATEPGSLPCVCGGRVGEGFAIICGDDVWIMWSSNYWLGQKTRSSGFWGRIWLL